MLTIRLSRRGRKSQPFYRLVVAEKSAPIKGKFLEVLGQYNPARVPKIFEANSEKITYWIGKGAQPSDTVASLLKRYLGLAGMEKYFEPRNKQRKKKKAGEDAKTQPQAGEKVTAAEKKAASVTQAVSSEKEPQAQDSPADTKQAGSTPNNSEEGKSSLAASSEKADETAPAEGKTTEPAAH